MAQVPELVIIENHGDVLARSAVRARRTHDFPASLIGSLCRGRRGDAVYLVTA